MSARAGRWAAVAVGLACLLTVTPAAHAHTGPLELGVQDDRLFAGPAPPGLAPDAGWDAAARLGVARLRLNVAWAQTQPAPGTLELAAVDAAIDSARARRLRVQLTLTGPAPPFATADGRVGTLRPSPAAFATFAGAVAAHTAGRVDRIALWNEPNWKRSLRPVASAGRLYRRLYRAAEPAVRAAAPGVEVLIGELAPVGEIEAAIAPLAFLRDLTCSDHAWRAVRPCAPLRADAIALHPYTLRWPPDWPGNRDDVTTGSLARAEHDFDRLAARGALVTPAGGRPAVDVTEWGWHARSRAIPEPLRSRFLRRGLDLIARDRWVRGVVWYELLGEPADPPPVWDTGLLDDRGRPRPAFTALRAWFARERRSFGAAVRRP